jgi:hypothetical protein
MIENRTAMNGILAAVLSASVVPIHGALAKEKSPAAHKAAARAAAKKHENAEAPKDDAKPDGGGAPATATR